MIDALLEGFIYKVFSHFEGFRSFNIYEVLGSNFQMLLNSRTHDHQITISPPHLGNYVSIKGSPSTQLHFTAV